MPSYSPVILAYAQLIRTEQHHKAAAGYYLNLNHAYARLDRIKGVPTPITEFYQEMCEWHSVQGFALAAAIEKYEGLLNRHFTNWDDLPIAEWGDLPATGLKTASE